MIQSVNRGSTVIMNLHYGILNFSNFQSMIFDSSEAKPATAKAMCSPSKIYRRWIKRFASTFIRTRRPLFRRHLLNHSHYRESRALAPNRRPISLQLISQTYPSRFALLMRLMLLYSKTRHYGPTEEDALLRHSPSNRRYALEFAMHAS